MPIEFIHVVRTHKNCQNYPPPLSPCTQLYAFGLTHLLCVPTFYIFTPSPPPPLPPPNKFLFRFKSDSSFRHSQFSSLTISRLFSFSLVSEVKLHWNNIKKISMVSVYSLRPVYTSLYTMINGNVIASFVQKKGKFWDFTVRTYYVDDPIYRLKQ